MSGTGVPGAVPRAGEPGLAVGDTWAADPAAAGETGLSRGVPAKVAISALAVGARGRPGRPLLLPVASGQVKAASFHPFVPPALLAVPRFLQQVPLG